MSEERRVRRLTNMTLVYGAEDAGRERKGVGGGEG